ncbi:MAG: SDR family oxidoreductase [Bdellovibrionaceae bacterium]|nr:SDR family oxidoreductase [Pseudobdellovibrionaceae bacterium]NUM58618.1 SDR family oxidoreductase [Pseudobdellovibrionaceae bacterium]
MKICVLGALGHIGSQLIRSLPEAFPNAEIVMVDNFLVQRYPSLFNLPKNGKYHFVEKDVTKTDLTEEIKNADVAIHLAAITNAAESFDIKDHLEKHNFSATKNIADHCVKLNVPMIFISTTSVYGTQSQRVDENCTEQELQPQSPYAETKLREEKLLSEMGKNQGLKYIACRFGTIFGTSAGMRFHTAVNKFCWQAVMGQPITVWKTALDQVRPYLDLNDAVRFFEFAIKNKTFTNEIYNVVTMNASVRNIVDTIKYFVPQVSINYVDSKIMNQLSYEVDASKLAKLGFTPQGDLKSQIGKTVEWLSQCQSAKR